MPIITKTICDGCGAEKKSENHWWRIVPSGAELRVMPLERTIVFSERLADDGYVLCGEFCVTKKVSEWMGAQK